MDKRSSRIAFGSMIFFLMLLIIGVQMDDVAVVLNKAIRVCLDCMGIG